MFKRKQTQQFEITEHPDVIKALNAMWEAAYDAGRRDALAIAKDFREGPYGEWWTINDSLDELIERLES